MIIYLYLAVHNFYIHKFTIHKEVWKVVKKIFGDYYLGLDIGTNSVGWAITDMNYNILNFNEKAMWGVHLFDPGKTAEERRTNRIARRRLERRKQRIELLQKIFTDEINNIDPEFFKRLNESRFIIEDRKHKNHDTLFNDPSFKDRDLFLKYPTIYHLRNDLMETKNKKPDIRLLYLACHHIIKYRGHFLFEGLSDEAVPEFELVFEELIDCLNQEYEIEIDSKTICLNVKSILSNKTLGVLEKKRNLQSILFNDKFPDLMKELCTLISGGKANLDKMFDEGNESLGLGKLTFKNTDFDKVKTDFEDIIPDKVKILAHAKTIYDWTLLFNLLKEYNSISKAKIASYKQHADDLTLLKSILKNETEIYKKVFKSEEKNLNNYPAYSGFHRKNISETNTCSQADFCAYLKKLFKEKFNDPEFQSNYRDMIKRIEDETFMPKQTTTDNSLFPNALHRKELREILDNMNTFYPFLSEIDETGFCARDKILMLCTFRIPYYVGPLNTKSERSWVAREKGEITPWNFNEKVNLDESAHNFMDRLVGTCTYLPTEKVLPKNSLTYKRYMLYNELNPLKINGERLFKLNPQLKIELVRDLFENPKSKKVTKKTIEEYLKRRGLLHIDDYIELSGTDDEIKSSLDSEIQLKSILGQDMDYTMAEHIIHSLTVFGDDKSRVIEKFQKEYSEILTDEQIKKLSNLRFKDWGRLSKKTLTGVFATVNGEEMNILKALETTDKNLMELLSENYDFKKQIDELNTTNLPISKITYDLVKDLYVSPAVRRGIWRSLRIVEDILKIMGHSPVKVFIETTRENQESKRTTSRKDGLIKLYEACKKENNDLINLFNDLKNEEEGRLRGKDLYAYYIQQGKCMYCGKPIDLNDLGNNALYDLDHILPRSKKIDDSIHNNLVLVCKEHNMEKSNKYPVPEAWQKDMGTFWNGLRKTGFINEEKYSRLIRKSELSNDELSGFINRQLVETSQSVKAVANTLGKVFGDKTNIVYVKANAVSDFRNGNNGFNDSESNERLKFIKCRSVNDYHHAKDAYLNIVVGNVYDVKFTKDYKKFVQSGEKYNLSRMFDFDVERNGICAWKAQENGKEGTIATIQKYMKRNNILFTRFAYEENGPLFDLNPVKKKEGQLPLKKDLPIDKYGGYNNLKGSYYSLIEHTKNKKKIKTIQPVLLHLSKGNVDDSGLIEYMENKGLEKPRILISKILKFSLFEIDGFRSHISGRTGDNYVYYNAEQLILSEKDYRYCKKIDNFIVKSKETRNSISASNYGLTAEENISLYDIFIEKYKGRKYHVFFESVAKTLYEKRNNFVKLSTDDQVKVLNEILHGFQCNAVYPSLELIGGPKLTGRIQKSSNISNFDSIKLIHQSPTGLFEKEINLKEL